MGTVYLGMLFPLISLIAIMGGGLYLLTKLVRNTWSLFQDNRASTFERRKIPDRRLRASAT